MKNECINVVIHVNEKLSPQQKKIIEYICHFRHVLHTHPDDLFIENRKYFKYLRDGIEYKLNQLVEEQGLKYLGFKYWNKVIPTDKDYEYYDLSYIEAINEIKRVSEIYNIIIEHFLKQIDDKYGTKYCPKHLTRMLWAARNKTMNTKGKPKTSTLKRMFS